MTRQKKSTRKVWSSSDVEMSVLDLQTLSVEIGAGASRQDDRRSALVLLSAGGESVSSELSLLLC